MVEFVKPLDYAAFNRLKICRTTGLFRMARWRDSRVATRCCSINSFSMLLRIGFNVFFDKALPRD
jgi:hypothetical protein